jgi:hypothetical protein
LESEHPDISVDLQEVFDRNYADGAYSRRIDYTREPAPALSQRTKFSRSFHEIGVSEISTYELRPAT